MADAEKKSVRKKAAPKFQPSGGISLESLNLDALPVLVMNDQEVSDFLKREMSRIMERAGLDSLRVCATSMKDGATHYYSIGQGNIYAQVGAVEEWLSDLGGGSNGGGLLGSQHPEGFEGPSED
jgi:hypothetical protein